LNENRMTMTAVIRVNYKSNEDGDFRPPMLQNPSTNFDEN